VAEGRPRFSTKRVVPSCHVSILDAGRPCELGATACAGGSRYGRPCLADQWCICIVDTADGVWIRVEVGSSRGVPAEAIQITISTRCARDGVAAAVPLNRGLKVTYKILLNNLCKGIRWAKTSSSAPAVRAWRSDFQILIQFLFDCLFVHNCIGEV
jgi:hypothetical protein